MSFCPRLSVSSVLRIPCRKWCWWRSLRGSLHRTTTSGAQDTNESVIPIDFIIEIAMKLHRRLSQHLPHIVVKYCFYHSRLTLLWTQRYKKSLSKGIILRFFPFGEGLFADSFTVAPADSISRSKLQQARSVLRWLESESIIVFRVYLWYEDTSLLVM